MKKFLFGVAFLIVGAGIAVAALMLTGRLADSTTPTSPTRTTSRPAYTTTTIDAALAALCIDLQDKVLQDGRTRSRAVENLRSHCPPRYWQPQQPTFP